MEDSLRLMFVDVGRKKEHRRKTNMLIFPDDERLYVLRSSDRELTDGSLPLCLYGQFTYFFPLTYSLCHGRKAVKPTVDITYFKCDVLFSSVPFSTDCFLWHVEKDYYDYVGKWESESVIIVRQSGNSETFRNFLTFEGREVFSPPPPTPEGQIKGNDTSFSLKI